MHLFHPNIIHFAVVFYIVAMISEVINMFRPRQFLEQLAKLNLGGAAFFSFVAVLTGLIDYRAQWMTEFGYEYLKTHLVLGVIVFFIFQLLANYRILFYKLLPKSAFTGYLVLGGIGLGLLLGTASLGKTSVYKYGAGVSSVMLNRHETESYLMELYNLDDLPLPDRAVKFDDGGSIIDTLLDNKHQDDISENRQDLIDRDNSKISQPVDHK